MTSTPAIELTEAEVVQLARSLVGLLPVRAASEILAAPRKEVAIGEEAVALVEDTLRKGLVRALARRGGGQPRRSIEANGEVRPRARLFERHAPPPLEVSAHTAELLRWLLTTPLLVGPKPMSWSAPRLGDELFAYLVAERLLELGLSSALTAGPFRDSPLCFVAYPVAIGRGRAPDAARWAAFVRGPAGVVIEGLAADLELKVVAAEHARRAQTNEAKLQDAEDAVRAGPVAYARAAVEAGRPDLGLPLLAGVGRLLDEPGGERAAPWLPPLGKNLPLSARQRVAQSAKVWLELVAIYRDVAKRARATGFVDEGYEVAQLLMTELEPWQTRRFARAEALGRALDGLEATAG